MPGHPLSIVWFKRDLRVVDHAPLAEAAAAGPVLPLYIVEPGLWRQPDASARQWAFVAESLVALRAALTALGQPLIVRQGEAVAVLSELRGLYRIERLWSHQETGNSWTYARDRAVAAWARAEGVAWHERPQQGVVRGLRSRQGWATRWERFMSRPIVPPPALPTLSALEPGPIPAAAALGLAHDPCPDRQRGGREEAERLLRGFLDCRGVDYARSMSSPLTATEACSRLSPHFAWGTLSLREARHAALGRLDQARAGSSDADKGWQRSLKAFDARLHWHCHFIQKLESEPAIETRPFHPSYAGLRGDDPQRRAAWAAGETGFPFLDAAMRMLTAGGWINFRMRAMLVAVSSYQLWLDWKQPALHLARLFTDYEPGIHYPQVQMQSGTTGINTIRMYNPVKQGYDQDPTGRFVRRWLPELAGIPDHRIHEPWRLSPAEQRAAGCILGRDYPMPIVDLAAAGAAARSKLAGLRASADHREAAQRIQERHGSRRAGLPPSNPTRHRPGQLSLPL